MALDDIGGIIGTRFFAADSGGYVQLIDWAASLGGGTLTFAIEGTGSYGAGLTAATRCRDRRGRSDAYRPP